MFHSGYMSKKNLTERTDKAAEFLNSDIGKEFVEWWKEHPHSGGDALDERGLPRWNINPYKAWMCDRYRKEFSVAIGDPSCYEPNPMWIREVDNHENQETAQS